MNFHVPYAAAPLEGDFSKGGAGNVGLAPATQGAAAVCVITGNAVYCTPKVANWQHEAAAYVFRFVSAGG
jgi:hypothetical protein